MRSARTAQTPRRRSAEPPKREAEPTRRAESPRGAAERSSRRRRAAEPRRVAEPRRTAEPAAEPSRAESLNTCAAPPTAHSHRAHRTTWRRKASKDTVSCCALADCRPPASSGGRPTASTAVFVNALSGRTMTTARYFLALESVGMNQICAATDTHKRHDTITILSFVQLQTLTVLRDRHCLVRFKWQSCRPEQRASGCCRSGHPRRPSTVSTDANVMKMAF